MLAIMSVHLGYVFLFVADVAAAVAFYEYAFGLTCRYRDEDGMFAELDTGSTVLAFAEDGYASTANGITHRPFDPHAAPPGVSLTLVSDSVDEDWARAVTAGAHVVSPPAAKPWGQTVGYLRDPHGLIVEIASEVDYAS